jgi:hypothetical protein
MLVYYKYLKLNNYNKISYVYVKKQDEFNMGVYEEDEVMDMESSRLDEDEDAFNGEEEVAEQLLNMSHGFFANEIEVEETVAVEEEPSQVPCPWCSRLLV